MKQRIHLLPKGLSIMMITLLLSGCMAESIQFDFQAGACDENIDPMDERNLGVQEVRWIDDTTLEVTAIITIKCAEKIRGGKYEIRDTTITLKYDAPQCEECVFCLCAHKLTYRFGGIDKKEYTFTLERYTP
ncbi:MAG: hypothetical protein HXS53_08050 [Theionarchaea archaeon]|nr:hypothetical protein [Theionarchaea archaeon]